MAKRRTRQEKVNASQEKALQPFAPKSNSQKRFLDSIYNNDISFGVGCPGTGKTMVALYAAVKFLEHNWIEKIYYLRTDIEDNCYRSRGSLPGESDDKFKPLLAPLLCNLKKILPQSKIDYYLNKKVIDGLWIEDIRGMSIDNSFLLADEVQNFTPHSVKTLLTRIGENSTFVLCGDPKQRDAKFQDGLSDAVTRLKGLDNIGVTYFKSEDIVRHPLISAILDRY
jgi:phosphate starvation-inducible PhoH-like protein